jgi:hypothetical protein
MEMKEIIYNKQKWQYGSYEHSLIEDSKLRIHDTQVW